MSFPAKTVSAFIVVVSATLAAQPAPAQSADMTYFLTSNGPGKGADLGGLEGADKQCQTLAAAAGAGGKTWHAYLSTQGAGAVNARDRIGSGPWQNAKGAVIAKDVAELHGKNNIGKQTAEKEAQAAAGALSTAPRPAVGAPGILGSETVYEFSPGAGELLDDLLPLTVKTALYQCFLDAVTSENVARMVSMKSATDNADKMVKALTMQYNRARQSQITTELSEIMGGVEAMKK